MSDQRTLANAANENRSPVTFQGRQGAKLFLIGAMALLVLAFYAATDVSYLAHDHALTGADWMGAAVCHRITARSFSIAGRQLPLCARCTGMYLGVALTFLALALSGRLRRGELPPLRLVLILVGFIGLMAVDGLNSYSHFFPNAPHLYEPRNWLRLATGMGTGLALGLMVFPALAQTLWRNSESHAVISTGRELVGLVLVAGAAMLLVLGNQPVILYVLALVSTAGVLLIVTAINTILWLVLLRQDGRVTRWQQAAILLLISLGLAVVQLGTVSLLRFDLTGTITSFPGL
ncbi:MAG TPA: DUF2085 domain-containing protein [Anaerolineae bacterium]